MPCSRCEICGSEDNLRGEIDPSILGPGVSDLEHANGAVRRESLGARRLRREDRLGRTGLALQRVSGSYNQGKSVPRSSGAGREVEKTGVGSVLMTAVHVGSNDVFTPCIERWRRAKALFQPREGCSTLLSRQVLCTPWRQP